MFSVHTTPEEFKNTSVTCLSRGQSIFKKCFLSTQKRKAGVLNSSGLKTVPSGMGKKRGPVTYNRDQQKFEVSKPFFISTASLEGLGDHFKSRGMGSND